MDSLGCLINIISTKMRRQIEKNNQAFGISAIQGRIIQYIRRKSKKRDVFQKDLELEFGLRGSSLSSTLSNLESQDLIKREALSNDQRLKRIVLTPKACEISDKINKNIKSVEEETFSVLSEEEIKLLDSLLNKISDRIKKF